MSAEERKDLTVWKKFWRWLGEEANKPRHIRTRPSRIGTDTDILLSQSQKSQLQEAVDAPRERHSDTTTFVQQRSQKDDSLLI